jgi:hypothetical protein
MLGSDATLQIHFIDSIASADVESDAYGLTRKTSNPTMTDIGNATNCRSDQS